MEATTEKSSSESPQPLHDQAFSANSSGKGSKADKIEQACRERDLDCLIRLADTSGGLLEDRLRQLAWPILLGCANDTNDDDSTQFWRNLPAHADEEQVQRDVDRAFVYYPNNEPEKVIESRRKLLYDLIVRLLRCHPALCYFQGHHDIVQVLMLVLTPEQAYPSVESISMLRIRDFMLPSLSPALKHLQLLPGILQAADKQLANHLSLPHPNYALPAALTLYAHEIQEYSDIARLFDFLLAHEPIINIYLFAAIILSRRSQLLDIPSDEHDMLFFTLQKLPQPLDLEPLVSRSLQLFEEHPPERLPSRVWRQISSSSVLKTTRQIESPQTMQVAENLLRKQTQELRFDEARQKVLLTAFRYRRPIASTAMAIAIGAVSIWLRKSGHDRLLLSFLLSFVGKARSR